MSAITITTVNGKSWNISHHLGRRQGGEGAESQPIGTPASLHHASRIADMKHKLVADDTYFILHELFVFSPC